MLYNLNIMDNEKTIKILTDFVDKYYPKGDDNRGFAIVVLWQYLNDTKDE